MPWSARPTSLARSAKTSPLSLAGGFNSRDGFFKDAGTGDRTNERNRWFARGQLLFEADSGLSVRVIGDYDKIDENCCGVVNLQSGPTIWRRAGARRQYQRSERSVLPHGLQQLQFDQQYRELRAFRTDRLRPWAGRLTSITAWRKTNSLAVQDPDFTSADLVYPFLQDTGINTFTQELRWTGEVAPGLNLLLGGFYLNDKVSQQEKLLYGTQFRPYANMLVQGATGGALNVPTLEGTFGTLEGDPTKYINTFFQPGQGFTNHFSLKSESISVFGQLDFEITSGLTLTLGGNYTDDSKRFVTNAVSTDTFSSIDFNAAQYAPFRQNAAVPGCAGDRQLARSSASAVRRPLRRYLPSPPAPAPQVPQGQPLIRRSLPVRQPLPTPT